jgi:Fe-S oxidoreductase
MANTLNYLDIKHVLTSCGTCNDQLMTYELGDIFKDASLTDIHEYLLENKVTLDGFVRFPVKNPLSIYPFVVGAYP